MKTLILPESSEAAKKAGELLKYGKIVAFPTDTVYGLGAVYSNEKAVGDIFKAKGRNEGKPLSILVSSKEQVKELAESIPEAAEKLMDAFWPGALTVIVKKSCNVPDIVTANGDTVGLRMPASDIARTVIDEAGSPLAAPSANTSGERSSISAEDVKHDLSGKIDMIIDGGICDIALASTIVDVTGTDIKILRLGSISEEQIQKVLASE